MAVGATGAVSDAGPGGRVTYDGVSCAMHAGENTACAIAAEAIGLAEHAAASAAAIQAAADEDLLAAADEENTLRELLGASDNQLREEQRKHALTHEALMQQERMVQHWRQMATARSGQPDEQVQ